MCTSAEAPVAADWTIPVPQRGQKEIAWVSDARFFDRRRLYYFSETSANVLSKILCKALAVGILLDETKDPPPEMFHDTAEVWGDWVSTNLTSLLRGMEPSTSNA